MRWLIVLSLLVGACGDDSATDAAPVGHFMVSWSITSGGSPATCESVGAASFDVNVQHEGLLADDATVACAGPTTVTTVADLPPGMYRVSANLLAADYTPLQDRQGRWVEISTDALEVAVPFVFAF